MSWCSHECDKPRDGHLTRAGRPARDVLDTRPLVLQLVMVGGQAGDGGVAAERGLGSVVIVEVQPAGQGGMALVV